MQRFLPLLVKAAVTGLLIFWSFRAVSLDAALDRIRDIDIRWMLAALAVLTLQVALQAIRWRSIVVACGNLLPNAAAVRLGFIAAFFNQTLPSTIGGDGARIWMLARGQKAGWRIATYSVLLDRVVGVFALAVLVTACLPWTFSFVSDPIARIAVVAVAAGGVAGGMVFAALSALKGTRIEHVWGLHHLIAASTALRRLARPTRLVVFVAVASIVIHVMTVIAVWFVAQSIQAAVSFPQLLCLIPPIVMLATVPISIAGWGLREGLMITAFSLAGLGADDGLAISILFGASSFVVGLIGGGLWIASRLESTQADA